MLKPVGRLMDRLSWHLPMAVTVSALLVFAVAPNPAAATTGDSIMGACQATTGGGYCCACGSIVENGAENPDPFFCTTIESSARWSCTQEFCSSTTCLM